MNPDLATLTIASRLASRSDSPHFVRARRFLGMAACHVEKLTTRGPHKPRNLRLRACLAQGNCQHLRIHAPPTRVLRIQYP